MNPLNQEMQEDEIDLRELWETIKSGKKLIIIFVLVITTLSFLYVLKLPNVYASKILLIPTSQEGSKLGSLGGLSGLAAMAGVNIGGGSSMTPDVAFQSLLDDYQFMRGFVQKHKIAEHYADTNLSQNYVFALNFRLLYDLFSQKKARETALDEKDIYGTIKTVQSSFSITSDKKTSLISISYTDSDRFYPPVIINYFLKDASEYLISRSLNNINEKLKYFSSELRDAESIEIRQSLSATISKIVEQKVVLNSKTYYECDPLTPPTVSYIADKVKPKRALILVVSFVTSIILGVFFVFFLNFFRESRVDKE